VLSQRPGGGGHQKNVAAKSYENSSLAAWRKRAKMKAGQAAWRAAGGSDEKLVAKSRRHRRKITAKKKHQ